MVYGPNFGHFIFEYLNRLAIFDLYGLTERLPVVVYDCVPKRWLGFLELMGVLPGRILQVPIESPPAYRKAWVSSACHYRDGAGKFRIWPSGLHWLRQRLSRAIGGPQLHKHRWLYLGRENSQWRKIVNQDQVRQALAAYGLECPEMGNLSAREQLEIISGADIVVSAAGAGSVMTHFAPEHCICILLAPRAVGTGYWGGLGASIILRQTYERLDCEVIESPDLDRPGNVGGISEVADYIVDLDLLRRVVEVSLQNVVQNQRWDALAL